MAALRGTERGSLNSWEAQVPAPVGEERRRFWAFMGRLEPKPLHEPRAWKGGTTVQREPPTHPYKALCLVFGGRKGFLGKF